MNWIEWVGIGATCLVLLSFLQKSEVNIRRINLLGCIVFVVYGILIGSISVWLLNGVCLVVHIVKLYKLWKQESNKSKQNIPTHKDNKE